MNQFNLPSRARPARRVLLGLALACLGALTLSSAAAFGSAFLPPAGQVFAGVGGGKTDDSFVHQTGAQPSVFQVFIAWGQQNHYFLHRADGAHARLMIHLSTAWGADRPQLITPAQIAEGRGDDYLLWLGQQLADHGQPVYVRLMAEMNGHTPYSAYDSATGRRRGAGNSTSAFRQAWRRVTLILRGGPLAQVNTALAALHEPPVRHAGGDLPPAPVAMLWVPQVAGAPDIPANSPRAYWPGSDYVDWIGTDFYSRFPNWSGLERFYRTRAFAGKPFVFGEWAIWGSDDPGFVRRLFGWSRSHPRVRMLVYNQGEQPGGVLRLDRYPRAARALRSELARHNSRFAVAPEWSGAQG
ncbi:MAG TPA: hypothetical protein VGY97_08540 [Solirubrobacteraceae bacterium]|nr:hypothetical protein [Solirubrobacteraceae bacterium]